MASAAIAAPRTAQDVENSAGNTENSASRVQPPPASPPSGSSDPSIFPFDAALPPAAPMRAYLPTAPFSEIARKWVEQIAGEALHDFKVSVKDLGMRSEDGALTRGKGGLAYTPHGFGQLLNLVLDAKPANLSAVLRWIRPQRRAPVYLADVKARTSRAADDLMVLRTFLAARPGNGETGLVRAVRAVVSLRHSGAALDDAALCDALCLELASTAPAAVIRGIDRTEGYAEVETVGQHLVRTLHWTNSETGSASLSFSAGARLRIVDAIVVIGSTANEVTALIANDLSKARIRHTAPSGKTDLLKQAQIASDRMRTKIRAVLTKGEAISDAWVRGLEEFSPGFDVDALKKLLEMDATMAWEILADAIEERGGFEGGDRTEFLAVLTDETRLAELPRGSAAHVTAVFAVMGKRATTMDDARRLQEIAGRWLMKGWSRH